MPVTRFTLTARRPAAFARTKPEAKTKAKAKPKAKAAAVAITATATMALAVQGVAGSPAQAQVQARSAALPSPGTVVSSGPLDHSLWIPGTTEKAFVLKYVTTDPFGHRATSTGTVFIPKGEAPAGGWPVISWAHGTSGLADACAPSRVGPLLPERDWAYLSTWMKQGYAIVASDYVGLGTLGLMPYLDGKTTAHNVVDMVKAGRAFAAAKLPAHQRLADEWVTIGQSQGGGASIYTARYATEFGGAGLSYRGAVGTGTPAYIEYLMTVLGPKMPPIALGPDLTEYVAYIYAGLRYAHPELGIDGILTPTGRKYLAMAETECAATFGEKLKGVSVGDLFTKPVLSLPNFLPTIRAYMGMPEDGFDKPFFMGHGMKDTDVPYVTTAAYAAALTRNGEPVTFKSYPTDHSGTMTASLQDSIPFVRSLFAR